jgi:hypothetical protein
LWIFLVTLSGQIDIKFVSGWVLLNNLLLKIILEY